MTRVKHCRYERKADLVWLESDLERYDYQAVSVLDPCPACKNTVIEWRGYHKDHKPPGPVYRVKVKDHEVWLLRLRLALGENPTVTTERKGMSYWVWGSQKDFPYSKKKVMVR